MPIFDLLPLGISTAFDVIPQLGAIPGNPVIPSNPVFPKGPAAPIIEHLMGITDTTVDIVGITTG